jgi:hypothetical protein
MFFTLEKSVKLTPQGRHNIQGDNEFIPRFRSFEKISSLKLRIPSVFVFITCWKRRERTGLLRSGLTSASEDIVYKKMHYKKDKSKGLCLVLSAPPHFTLGSGDIGSVVSVFSSHT